MLLAAARCSVKPKAVILAKASIQFVNPMRSILIEALWHNALMAFGKKARAGFWLSPE